MRHRYLIAYDVRDDKRLRRVFKCLSGYGDPVQYSIFFCDLSERERVLLEADLIERIKHDEDQVLLVNLGPIDGRGGKVVKYLGQPLAAPTRSAVIL